MKDKNSTLEHVFPDSLGGLYTIDDVCKVCNEKLGKEVDAPLINHLFMGMKRMELKIQGKKGAIPNIFSEGRLDDKSKVHYRMDKKGDPQGLYIVPKKEVINSDSNEKKKIEITVDATDQKRLMAMVNGELRRAGLSEMSADDIKKHSKVQQDELPRVNYEFEVSLTDWKEAIIKIAYESVYEYVGINYLNDLTAVESRKLLNGEQKLSETKIRGSIRLLGDDKNLDEFRELSSNDSMIVINFRVGNNIFCYINIFNTFEAHLIMSEQADDYSLIEDEGYFVKNDVKNKKLIKEKILVY